MTPYLPYIGGQCQWARRKFKWHQPAHHQLWSQQGPNFSPHSTAKTNDKSTFLRKNGLGRISDVVIASVHSEKTRLKLMMIMIIKRH